VAEVSLGVNVDHVATIRQARGTDYPDPVEAALAAERAGAGSITIHLREDRRHINDSDVSKMALAVKTKLNLEMAATDEMIEIAAALKPADVCLVPERREELTTEGGLAVRGRENELAPRLARLADAGVKVSLFIDPDLDEISAARESGAPAIELHTGRYADANGERAALELELLRRAALHAVELGLQVNAGHGLTVANVGAVAALPGVVELNIGHSIVARAIFLGIEGAVGEMLTAMGRS
jgi:pyridoxine 5-phosphate synthase